MMRLAANVALAVIIAMSASVAVDAQRGGGGGGARGGGGGRGGDGGRGGAVSIPRDARPSPSINSPSFPVDGLNRPSFPLRGPLGIGPVPRSPFDSRPGTYTRLHRIPPSLGIPFGYGASGFYGGDYYAGESTYEKMYRRNESESTTGTLLFEVTPASTLVFVDTAYVGSVSDLQARGVPLSAGRHYLGLEASGYDKKTIEITIAAGEPLHYRYDMTPTQRAAAVVLPSLPPQTMYAIPGCYGGNRPPVAANLPRGCDIAKLRVIRPQPRTNQ
jgi:hypothetical protein